jgi:hypothetical protein
MLTSSADVVGWSTLADVRTTDVGGDVAGSMAGAVTPLVSVDGGDGSAERVASSSLPHAAISDPTIAAIAVARAMLPRFVVLIVRND